MKTEHLPCRRQKELEEKLIEEEVARRVEELVAKRVEEELEKRKEEIEAEVLRRVEEAKKIMEQQMLNELESQRQAELEAQKQKEVNSLPSSSLGDTLAWSFWSTGPIQLALWFITLPLSYSVVRVERWGEGGEDEGEGGERGVGEVAGGIDGIRLSKYVHPLSQNPPPLLLPLPLPPKYQLSKLHGRNTKTIVYG